MAWENKEGDVSLNKNTKKNSENSPEFMGDVFLKGEKRRIALWPDSKQGGHPKYSGHAEIDGEKLYMDVQVYKDSFTNKDKKPSISGTINIDGEDKRIAVWAREGYQGWHTGRVEFQEPSYSPSSKGTSASAQSTIKKPEPVDDGFELDDDIPF